MRKWMIMGGVAAVALLGIGLLVCLPARADNTNSQLYPSGRYALVEGQINVSNVQQGGQANIQRVMLKVDTSTGQVWALQLCVNSSDDPTVRSAVWAPVLNQGTFSANGQGQVANPGSY